MTDVPRSSEASALDSQPPTDPRVLARKAEENLESAHFDAIGRVAVAWAFFEAEIDGACINLAEVEDERGICLTSQIAGSARKLDAFLSLARLYPLPEDLNKRLNKLYEDARQHAEKRNRIVHDPWLFDHPNPPFRYEATARKILKHQRVPMSTEAVLNFVQDIRNLRSTFMILEEEVLLARKSSQERSSSSTHP
jgi:hypothetical protein